YGIYNIIASVQSCKEKQNKVIEALKEYRKVDKALDESITQAKEAKQLIQEAWENMRKDLTSPEFMDDLKEVQNVILSLSTQSQDLKIAADKVQKYIEKAKVVDGQKRLYEIIRELSEGLGSIPFTLDCYTEKVQMAEYVLRECKRGTDSFEALYSQAIEQFDTKAKSCEDKIGYAHIEEPAIKIGLAELTQKENFQEDCILNSPLRKSLACKYKSEKYSDKEIAEKIEGVSEEQVEFLTKDCPKSSLSPAEKTRVCNLRKADKTLFTDEKIASTLGLNVDDVKSVKC
ncbi:uncharacterized protein LOC116289999, partial [Actinia tenebrosa]|uniref:Uncharacterized protein LOC116289999 n=1 Tax=Actinia tenebrosa TaxID=6105 RepID=A0A6P8HJQ9_ACTTE